MIPRAKRFLSALAGFIIVILVAGPQAQQPPQLAASSSSATVVAANEPGMTASTDVDLLVGRSTVINVGSTIARVSLTVPDIADAMVTSPTQLLVHGKTPGTISLFVWDKAGAIKTYEVRVRRDLSALAAHIKQLFPGEQITVLGSGKDVVVSGTVSSAYVIEKAANVAAGYVDKKENVVNLLKQQEGVASDQVMLRVRFAEVSRSAVTELGASLFTGPTGYKDVIARTSTQHFSAPNFSEMSRTADLDNNLTSASGKYTLSDFLNLFVFSNKYNVGAVVRALQEKGLFQSLAEPNLIATNGKEASFLAGGEFPIPVVQSGQGNSAVTIVFKEFGIRLHFTPTILGGDLINLKVKPEVSALDFNNAIVLDGFRIPALTTRRTETEVELRDGQTFAIAGLMNNTVTDSMRKIPGIGDIPILGWLFKSKAMQKNQTELVVMITPTIIRKGQMGVSEGLPSPVEPYMAAPQKTLPNPEAYVGSPRYPANQPAPAVNRPGTEPAPAPSVEPRALPSTATVQPKAPASKPAAPKVEQKSEPQLQVVAPLPAPTTAAAVAPLTPAQTKAIENARAEEKKAAEAAATKRVKDDKMKAREAKTALLKAEEDRKVADRIAKERGAREAQAALKNAEAARKKAEEDQKREQALTDAGARLKEAQAAYQAEIDKAKTKTTSPSNPRY